MFHLLTIFSVLSELSFFDYLSFIHLSVIRKIFLKVLSAAAANKLSPIISRKNSRKNCNFDYLSFILLSVIRKIFLKVLSAAAVNKLSQLFPVKIAGKIIRQNKKR